MDWVIAIFCFLLSFVAIYHGIKLSRLYFRVKKWPLAKAKILRKEIVPRKLSSDADTSETVAATYCYVHNDQTYTSHRVFLVELAGGEKGMLLKQNQRILEKIGSETNVYVNPEAPSESVIFCDGIIWYISAVLIGLFIFLIGLFQIV